jgi:TolA-binding protein
MDLTGWESNGPDAQSDVKSAAREFALQFPHCPNPALVQAAQAGVLPEELRDRLNQHVARCAACASLASDLFTLDEAPLEAGEQQRIWGRIRSGIAAEELSRRAAASHSAWWRALLRPMPVAVAAAAALLVLIGVRSVQHLRQPAATVSQARRPDAAAPPAAALRLEKPAVMLPPAAVLVWRGSPDAGIAARQQLQDALAPYQADEYGEAAARLEALAKKYPSMAEAQFYLGVCRLFLDRNGDAVTSL